jgi:hypothetical protein
VAADAAAGAAAEAEAVKPGFEAGLQGAQLQYRVIISLRFVLAATVPAASTGAAIRPEADAAEAGSSGSGGSTCCAGIGTSGSGSDSMPHRQRLTTQHRQYRYNELSVFLRCWQKTVFNNCAQHVDNFVDM